jgi:large subunit ribosomal protein L4
MIVLDALTLETYSTKSVANMLTAVGADKKALIVLADNNQMIVKSAANIPGVKTALVNTLNVYDILNADKFIVVKDAVAQIEEVYA